METKIYNLRHIDTGSHIKFPLPYSHNNDKAKYHVIEEDNNYKLKIASRTMNGFTLLHLNLNKERYDEALEMMKEHVDKQDCIHYKYIYTLRKYNFSGFTIIGVTG